MTALAVERPTAVQVRRGVPWKTVLPLAIVMAFADGYWMASFRGAVGSITRVQGPFASWVRESTVSIPLFVMATLIAVTLALRVFGAGPASKRARLVTLLMVAIAGTIVATVEVALSSWYDYILQSRQLIRMDAIHPMCVQPGCLQVELSRTMWLQVHSVAYIFIFVIITNLVLVAWTAAIMGGRISLAKDRPAERVGLVGRAPEGRFDRLVLLLAFALVAAAIVHAAVMPQYVGVWAAGGLLVSLLAGVQLLVAAALLLAPGRLAIVAALLVSFVPVSLWVVVHTLGLTLSQEVRTPNTVGLSSSAATLLELGAFVLALILVCEGSWVHRQAKASEHVRWIAVLAVVSLTAVGLAGSGLLGLTDYGPGESPLTTTSTHSHNENASGVRLDPSAGSEAVAAAAKIKSS
jgi:hypothetical protein